MCHAGVALDASPQPADPFQARSLRTKSKYFTAMQPQPKASSFTANHLCSTLQQGNCEMVLLYVCISKATLSASDCS